MQQIKKTIADFIDEGDALPTVGLDATVAEAVQAMTSQSSSCALVVDGERLAGIFTQRDFLNRVAAESLDPGATAIREAMTPDPETLRPEDCVSYAINQMATRGFRNVPIVENSGKLVANISVFSLTAHLAELFSELEEPSEEEPVDAWTDIGGG